MMESPAAWTRLGLVAVTLCGASGAAPGADFSVGIGGGVDRGRVDCVASFECDRASDYAKIFAAYRLNDAVDLQLAAFDAGRFKGGDTTPLGIEFGGTFKVSGVGLTAGYRWILAPGWSATARAGVASVHTRFEHANAVDGSASESVFSPLAGVAVAYAITPTVRVGVDLDLARFKVHTTRGQLQLLGVSAQFSF